MTNILLSKGIINTGNIYIYLKEYIKPSHRVLLVNLLFFNKSIKSREDYQNTYGKNGSYTRRLLDGFFPYGIRENQIDILNYYLDETKSAIEKIKKADVIYFHGGSPDECMIRINELKLNEAFLNCKDKIFVGSSAGAMIQFEHFHITPDRDYRKYSCHEGLGLLSSHLVEPHYKKRRKTTKNLRRAQADFGLPILLIPDFGCVIIDEIRIVYLGGAKELKENI